MTRPPWEPPKTDGLPKMDSLSRVDGPSKMDSLSRVDGPSKMATTAEFF